MAIFFDEIQVSSKKECEIIDITDKIKKLVKTSGILNGLVSIFSSHTTGAIKINEYETNLIKDFDGMFEKLVPKEKEYEHNKNAFQREGVDGRFNAHSHLRSMLVNSSETIPLREGKLLLGTWQRIFFVELDGPRQNRKIIIEAIG